MKGVPVRRYLAVGLLAISISLPTLAQISVHHDGDLVIGDRQVRTIENCTYYQRGNITVSGNGRLTLNNATLYVEQEYYLQYEISVQDKGRLSASSSKIDSNYRLEVSVYGEAEAELSDFTTGWLVVGDAARATIQRGHLSNELIVHGDPSVEVSDSDLRALDVFLTGKTAATVRDLRPGLWSSVDFGGMFEAGEHPDLHFGNTEIQEIALALPYPGAAMTCLDCEVFVTINVNERATLLLEGLASGWQPDLSVANLHLVRCTVTGWLTHPNGPRGELEVATCLDLGTHFCGGSTHAVISDSTVNLCALSYRGDIQFRDATLRGDMVFEDSRFMLSGTLQFGPSAAFITWHSTRVTRAFEVQARDRSGRGVEGVAVVLMRNGATAAEGRTDADGHAVVELLFDDGNYDCTWQLTATYPDGRSATGAVRFFTASPILVTTR